MTELKDNILSLSEMLGRSARDTTRSRMNMKNAGPNEYDTKYEHGNIKIKEKMHQKQEFRNATIRLRME